MHYRELRTFANWDLLLDLVALAALAMAYLLAGISLFLVVESYGPIAAICYTAAGLPLFHFAYSVIQRRSLVHQRVARVTLIFLFLAAAAFRLFDGETVVVFTAPALLVGWVTYSPSEKAIYWHASEFNRFAACVVAIPAVFVAAFDAGRVLGATVVMM